MLCAQHLVLVLVAHEWRHVREQHDVPRAALVARLGELVLEPSLLLGPHLVRLRVVARLVVKLRGRVRLGGAE